MSKSNFVIAGSLFLISLFLYTFRLEEVSSGFHGDEAELALFSLKISQGGITNIIGVGQHNHPIASFLPQAISLSLLGESIYAARLPSALFSALSMPIFYYFVRYLFNTTVACFSSILFLTSHLWIAMSRLAINNTQIVFFELISFFLLFVCLRTNRLVFFFFLGPILAMAFYLYAGYRIVPLIVVVVILKEIIFNKDRKNYLSGIIVTFFTFLLVSLPQLNFFLNNPYSFNARMDSIFILSDSGEAKQWRESNYKETNYMQILFDQARKTFMPSRDTSGQYGYPNPVFDNILVLLLLGILISLQNLYKNKYLILLLWFFITLIAGNVFIVDPFFLPRAIGALPVIFILVALPIDKLFRSLKLYSYKAIIASYFIVGLLVLSIVVLNLKIYFIDNEQKMFGDSNKYVATKIAKYLNKEDLSSRIIFLTAPIFYADFAPIRFLAPNINPTNIDSPMQYQPSAASRTIFVVHPLYEEKLKKIKAMNPKGDLTVERDKKDQIQYFIYKTY